MYRLYKMDEMDDRGWKFISDSDGVILYRKRELFDGGRWTKMMLHIKITEYSNFHIIGDISEGELMLELL